MKRCFKCQQDKAVEEFYRHPAMGDGHLGKCKECTKQDTKDNYALRREQYSDYDRRREQLPERRMKKREYQRKHRLMNQHKYKARVAVNNAIRSGRLVPKPCQQCGAKDVQAHHDDYSKPLEVEWLCFRCHREHGHGQKVTATDYQGASQRAA